jgi:hypothetical protein
MGLEGALRGVDEGEASDAQGEAYKRKHRWKNSAKKRIDNRFAGCVGTNGTVKSN